MITEKRLNEIIEVTFILLFFATPLIMFHKTSELFEFNKMIFIYFLASVLIAATLAKVAVTRKIIILWSSLSWPYILFILSQAAATFFSIDVHTSLYGYYSRFNGGFFSLIAYLIIFYSMILYLFGLKISERTAKIEKFLRLSLLGSFFVILWGLPGKIGYDLSCFLFTGQLNNRCWTEQFHPEERMFSTLGQPNWLAAFLLITFFMAFYFMLKSTGSRFRRQVYTVYLFFNMSALLFTRSRSAYIALILCGLLLAVYLIKRRLFNKKLLYLIFLILFVPIFLFKTGIPVADRVLQLKLTGQTPQNEQHISSASEVTSSQVTDSFDIRKIVWRGAISLGLRYPLFGSGVETFAYAYNFVKPKDHNLTSEWDFIYNKAHNEYLNFLATTGFIGLAAYLFPILMLIGLVFKKLKNPLTNSKLKSSDNYLLILCLGLSWLTILVTNFFGFSTTVINIYFYILPAFLVVSGIDRLRIQEMNIPHQISTRVGLTLSAIIVIVGSWFSLSYFVADIFYAKAENLLRVQEPNEAIKYYKKALFLKPEHVYRDKLSTAYASLAFVRAFTEQKNTTNDAEIATLIRESDAANREALSSSPKNPFYWKTRAKNYFVFYQLTEDQSMYEEADEALDNARILSPTDPKLIYTKALFYVTTLEGKKTLLEGQKRYLRETILPLIDESLRLKPNFRDGYFIKGTVFKKLGMSKSAAEAFNYILTNINPHDKEALQEIETLNLKKGT